MIRRSRAKSPLTWAFVVLLLALHLGCLVQRADAQGGMTVPVNVNFPLQTPVYVAVGAQTDISITATANNVPVDPYNPQGGSYAWTWTYAVEYAATPGAWGPPPPDAGCSFTVDPP